MGRSLRLIGMPRCPRCEGCWYTGRRHLGSLECSPGVVVPVTVVFGGSLLCPLGRKGSW